MFSPGGEAPASQTQASSTARIAFADHQYEKVAELLYLPPARVDTKDLRVCFQFQSESCSGGLSHTACEEELGVVEGGGQKSQAGASAGEVNNNNTCGGNES